MAHKKNDKQAIEAFFRTKKSYLKQGGRKIQAAMKREGIEADLDLITQMKSDLRPLILGDNYRSAGGPRKSHTDQSADAPTSHLARQLQHQLSKRKNKAVSITELCDLFDRSPKSIEKALEELDTQGYNLIREEGKVELSNVIQKKEAKILDIYDASTNYYKFGIVSDNHLGSKYSRLEVLDTLYNIFQAEGIEVVYNAGNWIDGEKRFNKHDLCVAAGMDTQINYMLEHYPNVKGITTYYIGGDDHEGWYTQDVGIDIGQHLEHMARAAGRTDLVYLGYMENDILLQAPEGHTRLRIQHPGGGSAYAISYTPQKIMESLRSSEIPDILILGHYHKASYNYIRGSHVVQAGCTQDQTPFMRKKRLAAHLGGWIIEFWTDSQGNITRFKPEFIPFFDSPYYDQHWKYIH